MVQTAQVRTFHGVFTGAVLPFQSDGYIDWESLDRHLDVLASADFAGVVVNADMGEGSHLLPSEREAVLEFAVQRAAGRVPILAGIHAPNTHQAAEDGRRAAKFGAAGLLVFPHPAFAGRPLDASLPVAHFSAIASVSGLPLIVYQTPAPLGMTFDIDVLRRIAEIDGVKAIKEGTFDQSLFRQTVAAMGDDPPAAVLADNDPILPQLLDDGAHGILSVTAAIEPERYLRLWSARGTAAAEAFHESVLPLAELFFDVPDRDFRARVKEALVLDGIISTAYVRPPLQPLSQAERARVARCVAAARSPRD